MAKNKPTKPRHKARSLEARVAWARTSAGPMKDRREPRKQSKNWRRNHEDG